MSMADDHTLRSYRSNDPYQPAEPARPSEPSGGGDPLAELARLIGQRDPFAEFGRSNARQGYRQPQEMPDPTCAAGRVATGAGAPVRSRGRRVQRTMRRMRRAKNTPRSPRRAAMTRRRSRPTIKTGTTTTGSTTLSNMAIGCRQATGPTLIIKTTSRSSRTTTKCMTMRRTRAAAAVLSPPSSSSDARCWVRRAPTRTGAIPARRVPPSRHPSSLLTIRARPRSFPRRPAIRNRARRSRIGWRLGKRSSSYPSRRSRSRSRILARKPPPRAPRSRLRRARPGSAAQPSGAANGSSEPKKVRTVTIRPDGTDVSGRPVGVPPPAAPTPGTAGTTASPRTATTPPAPRAAPQAGEAAAPGAPADCGATTFCRGRRERIRGAALLAEDRERGPVLLP